MRNIPLDGGKLTGQPKDWNAERDGPCHAISVLYGGEEGYATVTTAWEVQLPERAALDGGHLFFRIFAQRQPVISVWVQNRHGEMVGELLGPDQPSTNANPGRPIDIIRQALKEEIDRIDVVHFGSPGMLLFRDGRRVGRVAWDEANRAVLDALAAASFPPPPVTTDTLNGETIALPVMTLPAVAAEAQARAALEAAAPQFRRERLTMWTIYKDPADFPGLFVARLWVIGGDGALGPTAEMNTAATLEKIRETLPAGLERLERKEQDDPCIVESWL